jgi:thioredoxin 1
MHFRTGRVTFLPMERTSTSRRPCSHGEIPVMFPKLFRNALLIAATISMPSLASAGQPFDAKAFQASRAEGKSILVDVTAPWCPTCKQQRPIVEEIEKEHPDLVVYDFDFDTAKDVLRQFRVQQQSTLIVFKGEKEVARSTGETDPAPLRSLVSKVF